MVPEAWQEYSLAAASGELLESHLAELCYSASAHRSVAIRHAILGSAATAIVHELGAAAQLLGHRLVQAELLDPSSGLRR